MQVLILEDDRTMIQSLLKDISWSSFGIDRQVTASSVPEGCRLLEENRIDLMLCDIEVIKGTGIDLLRWAREHGYTAECIFLTNYANFEYAKEAVRLGSTDYIMKTEPTATLEAAIRRSLRRIDPQFFYEIQESERSALYREKDMPAALSSCLEEWELLLQNGEKIKLVNSVKDYLDKAKAAGTVNAGLLFALHHDLVQMTYKVLRSWEIQASALFVSENVRQLYRNASNSIFDLLKWINQFSEQAIELIRERSRGETLADKVKAYIAEHYSENISRQELANLLFVNSDYLSRIFNKEAGMQIPDYITQVRMEDAKRLLHTDATVSDIAIRVGIDNFSYFSTVFKKYTGMTPMEYRRENGS
ncbi:MAG: helix-turn-helix domain-containing protein [Desulfosporosinus sp.]|nr:helix-turn-helix domain-containing protein [Desulfosporosinus sp.]